MLKKAKATDNAAQIERFKETARALGCDEDEAAFDEKLKVIARHRTDNSSGLERPRSGKEKSGRDTLPSRK